VELPELPGVIAVKKMEGPLQLKKLKPPLPLYPFWPGFVVDTALYGGVCARHGPKGVAAPEGTMP
jgi:hypothetical protein